METNGNSWKSIENTDKTRTIIQQPISIKITQKAEEKGKSSSHPPRFPFLQPYFHPFFDHFTIFSITLQVSNDTANQNSLSDKTLPGLHGNPPQNTPSDTSAS